MSENNSSGNAITFLIPADQMNELVSNIRNQVLENIKANPENFNIRPETSDETVLFTTKEVAKKLKTSDQTVRSLCREEKITHYKRGSHFLISEDDLNEYLKTIKQIAR